MTTLGFGAPCRQALLTSLPSFVFFSSLFKPVLLEYFQS